MNLIERDRPLAALHEYASRARAGDGQLVLVTGQSWSPIGGSARTIVACV